MENVTARTVRVSVYDPASPTERRKVDGAMVANVYAWVGADYPADPAAWASMGATSRVDYRVTFAEGVPAGQ